MRLPRFILIITVFILLTSQISLAHPSEEMAPKDLPYGYGTWHFGHGSDCNINDLTFSAPYPGPAQLTDAEKYIVAGCTGVDGTGLMPWYIDVYQMVNLMYLSGGVVPDRLSLGEMKYFTRLIEEKSDETLFGHMKSPITDEFPRLDAKEFDPGQVYIRPLTQEEMDFLASKVEYYDEAWNQGLFYDDLLEEYVPVKLLGEVFYMRVYGEDKVLIETILFSLVDDPAGSSRMSQSVTPEKELNYNPQEPSWSDWVR